MEETLDNFNVKIENLIQRYKNKKGNLIPLLQDIQDLFGYVPKEAVYLVAKTLNYHPVDIYGILSFYSHFYIQPRGKHVIRVCLGTACHVMGSEEILNFYKQKLKIEEGQTTEDKSFTLEKVMCLGCCGMAPVVCFDESFFGRCDINKADKILEQFRN
ncbi:MAG: NADH-quinone oxidoreductase subunit NuoE [Thermodesulfovibrionales bacterium]|nr:NADH-quinone oxidoreductase subunit NuoE [Thermodesulfovibrionales bacterium]